MVARLEFGTRHISIKIQQFFGISRTSTTKYRKLISKFSLATDSITFVHKTSLENPASHSQFITSLQSEIIRDNLHKGELTYYAEEVTNHAQRIMSKTTSFHLTTSSNVHIEVPEYRTSEVRVSSSNLFQNVHSTFY